MATTPPIVLPVKLDGATTRAVLELCDPQVCIARRTQLIDLGVSDSQADRCLIVGRWRDVGAGLIALHNGPLTRPQEWAAAALAGGAVCGLAARTAAAAAGLVGWESRHTEVLVPRGTTYPALRGVPVRVHESRRFTSEDLAPGTWPPRVRVDRALVDAASWSNRPRTGCGLLAAGVQQRLTTAPRLIAELDAAGAIRRRKILRAALIDIAGGAQAVSELDFLRFCARHSLPRPTLQVVRRDRSGRRRYLDATLVGPTGIVVRVEIDGALHLVVGTYWDDMCRGNELSIAGEQVLRFPSIVIHDDDGKAADQLRRALGMSGHSARRSA